MNKGVCPKCHSASVYTADNGTGIQRGETITLTLGGMLDGVATIKIRDYVCTNCGYWESYIEDPKTLVKIGELAQAGKRWKKAE